MKKIKVAHVMNGLGLGGVSVSVHNLLRGLPSERYERHLFCLKKYSNYSQDHLKQIESYKRIGIHITFPAESEKMFDVVGDLCRWLRKNQIDILHTHSYKPNIYGRLAGVLCRNIKVIAHYRNYYDDKWDKDNSLVYDQLLAPFSHRLIANSNAVRDHVSRKIGISPEKIDVILNGVDLDRFRCQYDSKKVKTALSIPFSCKVVGIIGRICEQKGQDDFIRAAAIIKKSVPNTMFLIVGTSSDDALINRLKKIARSLGVEKDLIFAGYISDVEKIYAALDILVVPSRWEGFGLILVEAMASGTPIVATDIGPIPEVVGRDGAAFLVPPSSPDCIAAAAIKLLKNKEIANVMVRKGIMRAEKFSWNKVGMQLDDIYTVLMKEK